MDDIGLDILEEIRRILPKNEYYAWKSRQDNYELYLIKDQYTKSLFMNIVIWLTFVAFFIIIYLMNIILLEVSLTCIVMSLVLLAGSKFYIDYLYGKTFSNWELNKNNLSYQQWIDSISKTFEMTKDDLTRQRLSQVVQEFGCRNYRDVISWKDDGDLLSIKCIVSGFSVVRNYSLGLYPDCKTWADDIIHILQIKYMLKKYLPEKKVDFISN